MKNKGKPGDAWRCVFRRITQFGGTLRFLPFEWDESNDLVVEVRRKSDRLLFLFIFWLILICSVGTMMYSLYGFCSDRFQTEHKVAHVLHGAANIITIGFSTLNVLRGNDVVGITNQILHLSDISTTDAIILRRSWRTARILDTGFSVMLIFSMISLYSALFQPDNMRIVYPTVGPNQRFLLSILGLHNVLLFGIVVVTPSSHIGLLFMYLCTIRGIIAASIKTIGTDTEEDLFVRSYTLQKEVFRYKVLMIISAAYKHLNKGYMDVIYPTAQFLTGVLLCFVVVKLAGRIEPTVYSEICSMCVMYFIFVYNIFRSISGLCADTDEFVKFGRKLSRSTGLGKEWRSLRKITVGVGSFFEFKKNVFPYFYVIADTTLTALLSISV